MRFLGDDDSFDVEGFKHAVKILITAQDILVGNADYPTESIAQTSKDYRQLGLGYTNLGALLMALGLAYDSEAGRAWTGAITALMTGEASYDLETNQQFHFELFYQRLISMQLELHQKMLLHVILCQFQAIFFDIDHYYRIFLPVNLD